MLLLGEKAVAPSRAVLGYGVRVLSVQIGASFADWSSNILEKYMAHLDVGAPALRHLLKQCYVEYGWMLLQIQGSFYLGGRAIYRPKR